MIEYSHKNGSNGTHLSCIEFYGTKHDNWQMFEGAGGFVKTFKMGSPIMKMPKWWSMI